jgi:hypothetical protein
MYVYVYVCVRLCMCTSMYVYVYVCVRLRKCYMQHNLYLVYAVSTVTYVRTCMRANIFTEIWQTCTRMGQVVDLCVTHLTTLPTVSRIWLPYPSVYMKSCTVQTRSYGSRGTMDVLHSTRMHEALTLASAAGLRGFDSHRVQQQSRGQLAGAARHVCRQDGRPRPHSGCTGMCVHTKLLCVWMYTLRHVHTHTHMRVHVCISLRANTRERGRRDIRESETYRGWSYIWMYAYTISKHALYASVHTYIHTYVPLALLSRIVFLPKTTFLVLLWSRLSHVDAYIQGNEFIERQTGGRINFKAGLHNGPVVAGICKICVYLMDWTIIDELHADNESKTIWTGAHNGPAINTVIKVVIVHLNVRKFKPQNIYSKLPCIHIYIYTYTYTYTYREYVCTVRSDNHM